MKIVEVGLKDIGFEVVEREYQDPIRDAVLAKLNRDDITDREPEIVFFKKGGQEFAVVGFNADGHGCVTFYKVKKI